jgi:tRNA 2-thiouridine synthesizing protein A
MTQTLVTRVDCRGLACPLPIVETARTIRNLQPGEVIEVLATDPTSQQELSSWCRESGNQLVAWSRDDGVYSFVIRVR